MRIRQTYGIHFVYIARRSAFTLAEMFIVLTIVAALGLMAIPALARRQARASIQTTRQTLKHVRRVVMNDFREDMYETLPFPFDPSRVEHPQLKFLYDSPAAYAAFDPNSLEANRKWDYDPTTGRGWSGPYLNQSLERPIYQVDADKGFTSNYGTTGDPAPIDGWGKPIVLQQPVMTGGVFSKTSVVHARLVSAGPNGVIDTPPTIMEPSSAQVADDILVYLWSR